MYSTVFRVNSYLLYVSSFDTQALVKMDWLLPSLIISYELHIMDHV